VDSDGGVRIDALGGDIAENGMQRAPQRGTFEMSIGFEGCNGPLGDAPNDIAELLIEFGGKPAGVFGVQQNALPRESGCD